MVLRQVENSLRWEKSGVGREELVLLRASFRWPQGRTGWGEDTPEPGQMPWGLPSKGLLGKSKRIPSREGAPISVPYPLPPPVPPVVAVPGRHLAVQ